MYLKIEFQKFLQVVQCFVFGTKFNRTLRLLSSCSCPPTQHIRSGKIYRTKTLTDTTGAVRNKLVETVEQRHQPGDLRALQFPCRFIPFSPLRPQDLQICVCVLEFMLKYSSRLLMIMHCAQ